MARDPNAVRWDDYPLEKVTEMASRRVVVDVQTGRVLVQSYLRKGALVPVHTHAGKQSIHVLRGALAVTIGGAQTTVNAGDVLVVPAKTAHHAEALDDSVILDTRDGDVQFTA